MLPALQQKVLCQLATEEDDVAMQELMNRLHVPPKEYHLKVLRKVLCLYIPVGLILACTDVIMSTCCICKMCFSCISDGGTAAGKHWEKLQFSRQHK